MYKSNRKNIDKIIRDNNLFMDRSRISRDEYIILKRNWDKFCDDYQINTEQKIILLGFFKKTDRREETNKSIH